MSSLNPSLLALILVGFMGTPSIARAQRVDCAKMPSTAGQADCVNRELATSEVELKQTYEKALAEYTPAAKKSGETSGLRNSAGNQQMQWERRIRDDLKASQEAWSEYRERVCKTVGDWYNGGTFAEVAVPQCKVDMARARAKFLRTYFVNH